MGHSASINWCTISNIDLVTKVYSDRFELNHHKIRASCAQHVLVAPTCPGLTEGLGVLHMRWWLGRATHVLGGSDLPCMCRWCAPHGPHTCYTWTLLSLWQRKSDLRTKSVTKMKVRNGNTRKNPCKNDDFHHKRSQFRELRTKTKWPSYGDIHWRCCKTCQ